MFAFSFVSWLGIVTVVVLGFGVLNTQNGKDVSRIGWVIFGVG